MTIKPIKIPENIFRKNSNYIPTIKKNKNEVFNIWIFEKTNNDIAKQLSNRIFPKKNGVITYPLPFPKYIKVKNIINDIGINNFSNLKNTDILKEVQKSSSKKISELTFYENLNLGILINSFWKNQNLIIWLSEKIKKNEFEIIRNTNFNQIYLAEDKTFFESCPNLILTPSGCLYKNEKTSKKINLYETKTSISPGEYLDKRIFLWSSVPDKNGWKIKTDKKNTHFIKEIDNFADFKKVEISL